MHRHAVAVVFLLAALSAIAQTGQPPASDPMAVSLAQTSVATLTGGTAINDVTLNANVISIYGSDNETGTGTFAAKGNGESRVDLNLDGGVLSEVRNQVNGSPGGAWARNGAPSAPYVQHNCWTDAAWFFPALSSLTQTGNPAYRFKYIGLEQHAGVSAQHIQAYQVAPSALSNSPIQSLTLMDFYLDPTSYQLLAVGFNAHADNNMSVNIPIEIRFAKYQAVSGFLVPFHFQRLLNGSVVLDVTVTSAVFNTGLLDTQFALQ